MEKTTFDQLKETLKHDRSVRRFDEKTEITREMLEKLVDLTRYCASGRNAQPLRYRIVNTPDECAALFPALAWAGYLKDWPGPEEGERPSAYLVQCLDTDFGNDCLCDDGLQLQAITLGATTLGLSGCIIKAFNAEKVRETLKLPANMKPRYVLALGKGIETVVIEDMEEAENASFEYWREADGAHHVPKRSLASLLIN